MKPRVEFKRLPRFIYGECDGEKITIDLKKKAPVGHTYLHEKIHSIFPEWSETKVIQMTAKIWKRMTQRERLALYREMFRR
jgi:hypothetical protein